MAEVEFSLPPEIWMKILNDLTHQDWLALECVSKYLQSVTLAKWKTLKEFDFGSCVRREASPELHDLPRKALKGVWRRCGGTVEKITYVPFHNRSACYDVKTTEKIWKALAKEARKIPPENLKRIDFDAFSMGGGALDYLKSFVKLAPKLEEVDFSRCLHGDRIGYDQVEKQAENLAKVLKECKSIKKYTEKQNDIPRAYLSALPSSLEYYTLYAIRNPFEDRDPLQVGQLTVSHLFDAGRIMWNLKSLILKGLDPIIYEEINCKVLARHAPNLERLTMEFTGDTPIDDWQFLAELKLVKLDCFCSLCEGLGEGLAEMTKKSSPLKENLEELRLWLRGRALKSEDVQLIANFPNLKKLTLETLDTEAVSFDSLLPILRNCEKLNELGLFRAKKFDNACLVAVGEHCPNLQRLELDDCGSASTEVRKSLKFTFKIYFHAQTICVYVTSVCPLSLNSIF